MKKRILSMLMLLVMILLCGFITAKASNEQTQDGISVSIKTDKDSYTKDEPIQVDIVITNTNSYDISNIYVKKLLPEGVKLEEGVALEEEIDILRAGEQKICQAIAYVDDSFFGHEEEESSEASSDSEKESTPTDNNSAGSAEENSSEVNHSVSSNNVQPVNTEKIQISPEIITPTADVVPTADKKRNLEFTPEVLKNKNTLLSDENSNVEITGELYVESSEAMNSETQVSETVTDKEEHVRLEEEQNALAESVEQEEKNTNASKIILIVVIIILVICILIIFRKGQGNKALSILLCASIITPIFAQLTVNAQELIHRRTVSAEKIIYIDSKEVTIQAEISFVIPEKEDNSSSGDSDDKEEVVFADGVIVDEISQQKDYELIKNEDGRCTVIIEYNEDTSLIKEGSIFVLPSNEENMFCTSLVAKEIHQLGQKMKIICERPSSISDVLESINIEGTAIAVDYDHIEMLSDMFTIVDETTPQTTYGLKKGRSIYEEEIDNLYTKKFEIKDDSTIDNTVISGSFTFSISEVYAMLDVDFKSLKPKVNAFEVLVTEDFSSEFDLNFESSSEIIEEEICKIPIKIDKLGLVQVEFVVSLVIDVEGNAHLEFSNAYENGVEYHDGKFNPIANQKEPELIVSSQIKGSFGPKCEVNLVLFNDLDIFDDVDIFDDDDLFDDDDPFDDDDTFDDDDPFDVFGVCFKLFVNFVWSKEMHKLPNEGYLYCDDIKTNLSFIFELNEETLLVSTLYDLCDIKLSYEIELFNADNSPLFFHWHFENGVKVDECSLDGKVEGYVRNAFDRTPIKGARVYIRYSNNVNFIDDIVTDQNGYFCFEKLTKGSSYEIYVYSEGYSVIDDWNNFSKSFYLSNDPLNLNIDMLPSQDLVNFVINTQRDIVNGVTFDGNISYVSKVIIREGWNNVDGEILYENRLYNYKELHYYETQNNSVTVSGAEIFLRLPKGKYTITVSIDGYMDNTQYIELKANDDNSNQRFHFNMIPKDTEEKVILMECGDYPPFSTNVVPTIVARNKKTGESKILVGTRSFSEYKNNGEKIAMSKYVAAVLYKPDSEYTYSFYIDMVKEASDYYKELTRNVRIFKGGKLVEQLNVPYQEYYMCHVFDYDPSTEQFTIYNKLYDRSNNSYEALWNIIDPNKQKVALLSENLLDEQLLVDESVTEEDTEEENISEMESVEEDYNTTEEIEENEITSEEVSEDESCSEETTEEANAEEESEEVTLLQPLTEDSENYEDGLNKIE